MWYSGEQSRWLTSLTNSGSCNKAKSIFEVLVVKNNRKKKKANLDFHTQQKTVFKNEYEVKIFGNKPKLREFVTSRTTLRGIVKDVLQAEVKSSQIQWEE